MGRLCLFFLIRFIAYRLEMRSQEVKIVFSGGSVLLLQSECFLT